MWKICDVLCSETLQKFLILMNEGLNPDFGWHRGGTFSYDFGTLRPLFGTFATFVAPFVAPLFFVFLLVFPSGFLVFFKKL